MIFEVMNPSDKMTIEADDLKVAQAATILLGEGKIGLTDEEGELALPLLFLGGAEEFLEKTFGAFGAFVLSHREEIAKCLESVVYASLKDRKAIIAALGPEASIEALARFNDSKRSSMSDWGGYAHELAAHIRIMPGAPDRNLITSEVE